MDTGQHHRPLRGGIYVQSGMPVIIVGGSLA